MSITEKSLKSILKDQREEYQRYLGVVAEDFTTHVKLIAESLAGVQKQLIDLRDMVARNTEDIDMMKLDLHIIKDDLKERIDRKEFKTLEHRLAVLERKFSRPYRTARG